MSILRGAALQATEMANVILMVYGIHIINGELSGIRADDVSGMMTRFLAS